MANAVMRGRPIAPLVLSAQERTYLERQVRRHRVARSLSERCRDPAMRGWSAKQVCGCRTRSPRTRRWQIASPICEGSL